VKKRPASTNVALLNVLYAKPDTRKLFPFLPAKFPDITSSALNTVLLHFPLCRYSNDETGAKRWLASKFSAPLPYLFVVFNSPQRWAAKNINSFWKEK
jgi:hypothetical protein